MKKSTCYLLLGGLVALSLALGLMLAQPSSSETSAAAMSTEQQVEQPLYTIRVYHNLLAICRGTSDTPWRVTDIHVSSLREYDQKLMEQGFPLYSQQDLTMFLEDYGS